MTKTTEPIGCPTPGACSCDKTIKAICPQCHLHFFVKGESGKPVRYRAIKATIVTATIAAIKHMYELHDQSEFKLVCATRCKAKPARLAKLWAEYDLLERAIVRAEATLPQRIVDRVKSGKL